MRATAFPQTKPFDPITGDLLPEYRDAYLLKQLSPDLTQTIEAYLRRSPVQANIMLGRYHELAEEALRQGRTLTAPHWVQQELLFQPTVSRVGPLRRPVVRVAVGLFLGLCGASAVQWMRNEPLVPAPVVAAVTQAATSASEATQRLVQQLTQPAEEEDPAPEPKKERAARTVAARVAAQPNAPATLPVRAAAVDPLPADSVAVALPEALPTTPVAEIKAGQAAAPAAPLVAGTVRGRIVNEDGRPLVGATVLVKGTTIAASTNGNGEYVLEAPAGSVLQFGYGGYTDELMRNSGSGSINVTLLPRNGTNSRKNRLPNRALSLQ